MTTAAQGSAADPRIIRLTPQDGLFLRAEHLDAIQAYARSLATAVGRATGTGAAYGLTTRLVTGLNRAVEVEQGLALDPGGRPLLVTTPIVAPLPDPVTATSGAGAGRGIWVVELVHDDEQTGPTEQVFGLLCDDPCGSGQQFTAYLNEGVSVRLRSLSLTLGSFSPGQFRSAVASAYFDLEQRTMLDGPLLPIGSPAWATGNPGPAGDSVPIGLLLLDAGTWVLDVWAARRDLAGTPAERSWLPRTGRRPMDVFRAQVLQFQAQLADLGGAGAGPLPAAGFGELPPAGYLPVDPASGTSVDEQVSALLGEGVDLRFCTARADEIGLALEHAQHLDRIPLLRDRSGPDRPKVDILVPDGTSSAQTLGSHLRFARGSIKLVPTKGGKDLAGLEYLGLARLDQSGGRLDLAFAGSADSQIGADPLAGLWVFLHFDTSPFALRPPRGTGVLATVAAHQPRTAADKPTGEAIQQIDLSGQLECLSATASGTGLPTFVGEFHGRVFQRFGAKKTDDSPALTVRLDVQPAVGVPGFELLVQATGDLTFSFRIPFDPGTADDGQAGGQLVIGKPDPQDKLTISAGLTEIAAADVPASAARLAAERGLTALATTTFPRQAVKDLFAGAGPAATGTALTTALDWVFFTRRHLRDCAPGPVQETPAIRLDVYVEQPPDGQVHEGPDLAPRYLGQLAWDGQTNLLQMDSVTLVGVWAAAHPGEIPVAGRIWLGSVVAPAQVLADQVVDGLSKGTKVVVTQNTGTPPVPVTATSAGALVLSVGAG